MIKTKSKDSDIVLALLQKNSLGMWKFVDTKESVNEKQDFVRLIWICGAGIKRFLPTQTGVFEHEWNYLYYGTNAIQPIEISSGQLPENVTVNVCQAGEKYYIHLVTYSEPDILGEIDMESILRENGCIS